MLNLEDYCIAQAANRFTSSNYLDSSLEVEGSQLIDYNTSTNHASKAV